MATGYFKTFNPEDASQTPFVAHKQWTISDGQLDSAIIANTGSKATGSSYYLATYSTSSTRGFQSGSSAEPSHNNKYDFIMHSSIDQMFYRFSQKGLENESNAKPCQWYDGNRQNRDLHRYAHVVSIPQAIYGEGIQKNSVVVVDNPTGIILKDDGYANLYDGTIDTSNFVGDDNLVVHVPFSEGYKYLRPPHAGYRIQSVSQGRHYGNKPGLNYNGPFPFNVSTHKVTFVDGMHGYGMELAGNSGSYAILNKMGSGPTQYGTNQEFAVSMWLKIPVSQSVSQSRWGSLNDNYETWNLPGGTRYRLKRRSLKAHQDNIIMSKRKWAWGSCFPFEISVGNSWPEDPLRGSYNGKIVFRRSDGHTEKTIVSSEQYNDNTWRHFLFQKTGSNLEMYCNGTLIGTKADYPKDHQNSVNNNWPISIGGGRIVEAYMGYTDGTGTTGDYGNAELKTHYRPIKYVSSTQIRYEQAIESMVKPFKGAVDEVRIYNQAIPVASITALSESVNNTNIVGNVFYDYGIATVTDPRQKYRDMFSDNTKHYISFKGSHTIIEEEYYCHIRSTDFDVSMNPTIRKNNSSLESELKGVASSSYFHPYITTVGLYNNDLDLIAVAKLASPLKKPKNMDTTIVVRIDR